MSSYEQIITFTSGGVLNDVPYSLILSIFRYILGREAGMEVSKDMGRGIDCIRRAADLGHDAAKWDLACIVGEGDDLRLDFERAVSIYSK